MFIKTFLYFTAINIPIRGIYKSTFEPISESYYNLFELILLQYTLNSYLLKPQFCI